MSQQQARERQQARRIAKVALGIIPPPKRAREGSLSLTRHQLRVIKHIQTKPSDDLQRWAHKLWLSKSTPILERMLKRGLLEVDAGRWTITVLGEAAARKAALNYHKFARFIR